MQSWIKINSGLVKMYEKEVRCSSLFHLFPPQLWTTITKILTHFYFNLQMLAKFPVIQHVLFGSLLEFKPVKPGSFVQPARLGMLPPRRIPTATLAGAGDAQTVTALPNSPT